MQKQRTITDNLYERIIAQVDEVKIQGFEKLANKVEDIVIAIPSRKDGASYTYASEDFEGDVEKAIWKAVIRTADFHNTTFDIQQVEPIVKKIANDLISELRVISNNESGVGAFEPTVPGEMRATKILEISEDDEITI